MRGWVLSAGLHLIAAAAGTLVLREAAEALPEVVIVPVEAVIGDVTNISPVAPIAPIEPLEQLAPEGGALESLPEQLELPEIIPDPDPPKTREKPKPKDEPRLDLDNLAALIDRDQKQPGQAASSRAPANAPQGEKPRRAVGAGTGLTATAESKIQALLKDKIERQRCWRAPTDARDPERLTVVVSFRLDRNGALIGQPRLETPTGLDRELAVAGQRALAAVRLCAPYDDLPAEHYEGGWDEVTLRFGPEEQR